MRRIHSESSNSKSLKRGKRTLIYGAGSNGKSLADRFKSDLQLNLNVVGFVDDDVKKQGLIISEIPVLGTSEDLESMILAQEIHQLIISIPNVSGSLLRRVITICARYNVRPLMTSRFSKGQGESWRDMNVMKSVELTDLLQRSPRDLDIKSIQELIQGKKVLITGAGGSIGSELTRQVFQHAPKKLVILDHSEFNLFEIDRELRSFTHSTDLIKPVLLDLKEVESLEKLIAEETPDLVIHAAAYKHVHLVQANPFSAIKNNIFATQALVDTCVKHAVTQFLMISTDKAVNPVGIMGATKRVCELIVTLAAIRTGKKYSSVRFGNVLGSSGSLIPTLTEQIKNGGPVTVTDPEMTRYFMLIPEAVSLVLKGCTIAKPGDVHVLKMGDPVRILDIAKNMIALSGKTEDEIPIVFTGMRPGEKLFEELYIRGDELNTEHPDILTLPMGDSTLASSKESQVSLSSNIEMIVNLASQQNPNALSILAEVAHITAAAPQPSIEKHLQP